MTYNLLLVGCGNMAGAMLAGWLEAGLVARAVVVKPTPLTFDHSNVEWLPPEQGPPPDFSPDMIVLGVKPQMLDAVLPAYNAYASKVPFLSLAAGKTLAYFARALGDKATVIRTMPNIASSVGKGVTGCIANASLTSQQREIATALLQANGTVHWIEEAEIDALTAISGCGPAYVFLLAEVLQQGGQALGLEADLAAALARETIIGAARLLEQSQEEPATMRAHVTSKAGVTEVALKVLMDGDVLGKLFVMALQAAKHRAGQLAD